MSGLVVDEAEVADSKTSLEYKEGQIQRRAVKRMFWLPPSGKDHLRRLDTFLMGRSKPLP